MQLVCPQSQIHGWAGLAMELNMHALLEEVLFAISIKPGNMPIYTQFATPLHIENGRRNIPAQQELLPVLQEHQPRMLQNVR
jgi:hypothetical protein